MAFTDSQVRQLKAKLDHVLTMTSSFWNSIHRQGELEFDMPLDPQECPRQALA